MATASSKPVIKTLPIFNPTYYLAWAADVRDAFEDRGWTSYLIASPGTDQSSLDPATISKARAFLRAAIPYEYKHGLETFTTAAEIWTALEQRYASTSREDELRLKAQLMDLRKSRSDSIDQHIQKFGAILSAVLAQQQPERRFDNPEINSYFLCSLEHANIPDEDWKGFITFPGKSWLTITKEQLYSDARTYYNAHIQPHLTDDVTNDSPKVLAIRNNGSSSSSHNFNNGNGLPSNRLDANRLNNNFRNRNGPSHNLNIWCDYHRRPGNHSTSECRAKLSDPEYLQFQQEQQLSSDYEPPLVYPTTPPSDQSNTRSLHPSMSPKADLSNYHVSF